MIAYLWALNYPQEVEAVVLINTSLAPTPPHIRIRLTGLLKLTKIIRNKDTKTRERDILKLTTHLLGSKLEELAEIWGEHATRVHTSRTNTLRQLIAASRITRNSGRPEVPTLILCSDKDDLVNPQSSYEIAKDWGATLIKHPEAGHDLALDAPDWVVEKIVQFLLDLQ